MKIHTSSPLLDISKKDKFSLLFFVFFWLTPMFYIGVTNKDIPLLHRTHNYMMRTSQLFVQEHFTWPMYYIQARSEGSKRWVSLDEHDYFKMQPAGYRTRLNQLMIKSHYTTGYEKWQTGKKARYEELAQWIAKRYQKLYPQEKKLSHIRFVRAIYVLEKRPSFTQHWIKPPLAYFPKRFKSVILTLEVKK